MTILQARRYQPRDADLTAVAASGLAAAWTAYTPTITAGTGSFTTVSASGRYLRMGKVILIAIQITITTNGTAATYIRATLPATAGPMIQHLLGADTALTGKFVRGQIYASTALMDLFFESNSYPGASGATIYVSGSYEAA